MPEISRPSSHWSPAACMIGMFHSDPVLSHSIPTSIPREYRRMPPRPMEPFGNTPQRGTSTSETTALFPSRLTTDPPSPYPEKARTKKLSWKK